MDTHTVDKRNDNILVFVDDELSDSSSSSEENSGGGTSRPTVRSTAQNMENSHFARVQKTIKLKENENAINNLSQKNDSDPESSINKLKAYQKIRIEIRKAINGKESFLTSYPDLLATVKKEDRALKELIDNEMKRAKAGHYTDCMNVGSGIVSYLLTFCTGTLTASGTNMPLLSPPIIAACWTIFERVAPMIRATSWTNPHADVTYPEIMRMTKRISKDWVRQLFGLGPKYFFRNGEKMTACEVRQTLSLFKAWKGKFLTDDIPPHTFTLFYISRNVLLKLFASSTFLSTPVGKAVSLGTLAAAGVMAGGTGALAFQKLRGCQHKAKNPGSKKNGESLVITKEIWKQEKKVREHEIILINAYLENITTDEKQTICPGISLIEEEKSKAKAKSETWSSLLYEFGCLFVGKSQFGENDNGEVAGKLYQTISGFFGKMLCLSFSAFYISYVVTVFATTDVSLLQQLSLVIVAPIILIVGFGFRKELEIFILAIMGLLEGLVDVLQYKRTGIDKYTNDPQRDTVKSTPPRFGVSVEPDGDQAETSMLASDS